MMVATNPGTFRAMLRCQQELQRTLNRLSLQAEDTHQTGETALWSKKIGEAGLKQLYRIFVCTYKGALQSNNKLPGIKLDYFKMTPECAKFL